MAFTGPIRAPFENKNGSLSDAKSHYAAYVKVRADSGNPVKSFSRRGVPEGFHHECYEARASGVGPALAQTHKHLACSIRDGRTKHVFDASKALPATPALWHHVPPAVDHRGLPHFAPSAARGNTYRGSDYGYEYCGHGSSFSYGSSVPMPSARAPVALPPQHHHAASRTRPVDALPTAGLKTPVYERAIHGATLHSSTYPRPAEAHRTRPW